MKLDKFNGSRQMQTIIDRSVTVEEKSDVLDIVLTASHVRVVPTHVFSISFTLT